MHTINPSNCVIAQNANVVLSGKNVGTDECDAVSSTTKRFGLPVFPLPASCRWRRQIPSLAQAERRRWHGAAFSTAVVLVPFPNLPILFSGNGKTSATCNSSDCRCNRQEWFRRFCGYPSRSIRVLNCHLSPSLPERPSEQRP